MPIIRGPSFLEPLGPELLYSLPYAKWHRMEDCVFWLTELKFVSKVRRRIATKQKKKAPHGNSISK
jgi:hypothetical protein